MGYSVGWDSDNNRWMGYGVPSTCEHPECNEKVDRGMGCSCEGCGLAFCGKHWHMGFCEPCLNLTDVGEYPDGINPFRAKPEHPEWLGHLRNDPTWAEWRKDNMAQLEAWDAAAKEGAQQG
ncbi:hypothetical protein [Comamonas suwonensis]|uniref:hypothetical protein n=1 Tax=Comamonas suwonensis TaxID=2606214 RepID=UPI00145F414A|nr:hypothetical protein [Comamonas suwonensis]MBI1625217.1 hypothetical protein [Comamonas suwonensis]